MIQYTLNDTVYIKPYIQRQMVESTLNDSLPQMIQHTLMDAIYVK
jgi:hypothetical protein